MGLDLSKFTSDSLQDAEVGEIFKEISARSRGKNTKLSEFATSDDEALRQKPDEERVTGHFYERRPYDVDGKRVLFSNEFERLAGKTQCVTSPGRDHISNRMVHSLRVSETAASIARSIGANEDLARTIGLAHDIGHSPLGHMGELLISSAIKGMGDDVFRDLGVFKHNIQGVNVVDRVSSRRGFPKGSGLNLTDQVRHGIVSHDGETDKGMVSPNRSLSPQGLNADIDRYIDGVITESGNLVSSFDMSGNDSVTKFMETVSSATKKVQIVPATLEGCIVLLVDTLHYAPEDFEDMISLGVAKRSDLPLNVAQRLGTNSGDIMNSLIIDLLVHSYGKDVIGYSKEVFEILKDFKRNFLYPKYKIVNSWMDSTADDPRFVGPKGKLLERTNFLFQRFYTAIKDPSSHPNSSIVKNYLEDRNRFIYINELKARYGESVLVQVVVDYVAGFTDRFFFEESEKMLKSPRKELLSII
ncbi:MAG: HD domain-containing protein [Candidatus Peregrinibacteria bacterium]|nr:HD domain-containing protein [Candidatus Peregrinibacteria bacterium]